jgi:hypothetical protein
MGKKKIAESCGHEYEKEPFIAYDPIDPDREYEFCSDGCMQVISAEYNVRFSRIRPDKKSERDLERRI